MTIGFPDFGRQTRQSGVQQVGFSQVVNAQVTTGIQFIADYGLLDLTVDCTNLADYYQVNAIFYADSLGNQQVYTYQLVTVPGVVNGLQLPAPGQYVQIKVTPKAGTDASAMTLLALSTNQRHPNPWTAYSDGVGALHNVSINAGVVRTDNVPRLITGPVVINATGEGSGTWHLFLDNYLFSSGAWQTFWRYDTGGNTNAICLPVNIPAVPIRLNMSNDGSAAHQFLYSICPQMV